MKIQEEKKRMQRLYEGWLNVNGWAAKRCENKAVLSDTSFIHPSGLELHIIQEADMSDRIHIINTIFADADAPTELANMQPEERTKMVREVKKILLQIGAQYNLDYDGLRLKSITIQRTLYGENLTKQVFFDNISKVIDGTLLVLMYLESKVNNASLVCKGDMPTGATFASPYS